MNLHANFRSLAQYRITSNFSQVPRRDAFVSFSLYVFHSFLSIDMHISGISFRVTRFLFVSLTFNQQICPDRGYELYLLSRSKMSASLKPSDENLHVNLRKQMRLGMKLISFLPSSYLAFTLLSSCIFQGDLFRL